MFDPYRTWLSIPEAERPPTHYQLLGVAPTEPDAEVIKEAALRQTSQVRVYQTGPHAEVCTRLLNEIAEARAVLLNKETRQAYDAGLQSPPAPPRPAPAVAPAREPAPASPPWLHGPVIEKVLAAIAYGLLLLVGLTVSFCLTYQSLRRDSSTVRGTGPAGERSP